LGALIHTRCGRSVRLRLLYPVGVADVKGVLFVYCAELLIRNAGAFPDDTASVCCELLADRAAVHAAPAAVALEIGVRFPWTVIVIEALFCVPLAVDTPAYCHQLLPLLDSGE
jgi:hypothetical protein